jgi:4-amino-4-deoxy-L-arabinose transferase-like glycosyltransferase
MPAGRTERLDLPGWAVWPLLTSIVVLGAALRIINLDSNLWYDEIRSLVDSVRSPLGQIVTHFPSNNDHLFYSVLANLSIDAFGEHAWTLRLPAVTFGIASIPMLYWLGAGVTTRLEALAAAGLLAVSYHHIWFSQNARGYTILLFCALLATHLLLIGLRHDRRSAYLGYAVVTALGTYTHLTMALVSLCQAAIVAGHLLAQPSTRREPRAWINPVLGFVLAGLLTLLLYLPVLLEVQAFFGARSEGARVASASWALWETLRGLRLGYTAAGAALLGGLLLAAGGWSYLRQSPTVLALFVLPGPAVFAIAALLQRPTFPRFFFFVAGFALLIAVRGATTISTALARSLPLGGWAPAATLCAMLVVSTLALPYGYRYPKQDFEQALRFVESQAGPHDLIAVVGGGAAFPYQRYYQRSWPRLEDARQLAAARGEHEKVWLVYTLAQYIEAFEAGLMSEIRTVCSTAKTFPGTVAGGNVVVASCRAG